MGSPGPPLLQEVKLSGLGTGGPVSVRLRQEGNLALRQEVKLSGQGTGGGVIVRLRQEGNLALRHEVKLSRQGTGGGVIGRLRQEDNLALRQEVKLCRSGSAKIKMPRYSQHHLYYVHRSSATYTKPCHDADPMSKSNIKNGSPRELISDPRNKKYLCLANQDSGLGVLFPNCSFGLIDCMQEEKSNTTLSFFQSWSVFLKIQIEKY